MIKLKYALFTLLIVLPIYTGCGGNYPYLPVVEEVDLERYAGLWYEIASFPAFFQEGCHCTTAEYRIVDKNTIEVINSCRQDSADGEPDQAEGEAWVVDDSTNARLEVQFFWPFTGDYYIIALDRENYQYAMVGTPSREYCWILSREPRMADSIYQKLVNIAADKGFDISKFQMMDQSCWE